VLRNAADPEHRDMKDWVGRGFDPETFDVDKLNKKLATLSKRWGFGKSKRPAAKLLRLVED
jgi:hypothetical protein